MSILGNAQYLRRHSERARQPDPERLAEGLTHIEAAAHRMQNMIAELLDLARLEAGQRLELHRAPVDRVALVQGCVATQAPASDRHQIRVATELQRLVGGWDVARLERVLGNLLGNAIRYSPAGGEIVVRIRQEQQGDAGWAVVQVEDHGLGIPAAELPRVTERFFRASNVTGAIQGTGIGLASARLLVEEHGGTLALASTEGEGTVVTLRLPLTAVANDSAWASS